MDEKLFEQLEAVIDALACSHMRAEIAMRTMKKQRVRFDLDYDHLESDIKHLIDKLRYMQRVAERREIAEAETEPTAALD